MRVVLVFAPVFQQWGADIVRDLNARGAEVIGICTTGAVYRKMKSYQDLSFLQLDNLEDKEISWAGAALDEKALRAHEENFGADFVRRVVLADRQLGSGYITGGPVPDSALRRKVKKNDDAVRASVTGLLDYLDDLYAQYKPDSCLCYVVAGALGLALSGMAERYGSRFYNFAHSRIGSRVIMDTSPNCQLTPLRDYWQAAQNNPSLIAQYRQEAESWLTEYRTARDQMPEYEQRVRANLSKNQRYPFILKSFILECGKALLYPFVRGRRPFRGEGGRQKAWRSLVWPVGARFLRLQSFYTPVKDATARPYVYFALHVEPEASTMVVAPYHTNQLAVIEALSKALPLSHELVVKEHPSMLGKRPRGYYEKIYNMPGVSLVAPYENSLELVRNAALVTTITGTVAWEAVLLQRPALVVGDSPFLALGGGITHCPCLSELASVMPQALAMPAVDDEILIDFIACIFAVAIDFPLGILWDDPDREYLDKNRHVTRYVADILYGQKSDPA